MLPTRVQLSDYLFAISAIEGQHEPVAEDWLLGTLADLARVLASGCAMEHSVFEDLVILCCHGRWSRTDWMCSRGPRDRHACPLGSAKDWAHARCKAKMPPAWPQDGAVPSGACAR